MLRQIIVLSKRSKIRDIHPLEKILFCICPIIVNSDNYALIILLINIGVFILAHYLLDHPPYIVMNFVKRITIFVAATSLIFIIDQDIYYYMRTILRSISAALNLAFLALTTPMDDILFLLSKNKYLRDVSEIAKSMERFIILLEEEYHMTYIAMKARGGFGDWKKSIKDTGKLGGILFLNTLYRWKEIKDGIHSRGYKGSMPFISQEFHFSIGRFLGISIYQGILILGTALLV